MGKHALTRIVMASVIALGLLASACGDDGAANNAGTGAGTPTTASGAATGSGGTDSATTTVPKNTASDQGVTESEIKVVVLSADLTNLIKSGLIKGVPANSFELNQKRVSYYFDQVNASGGINGRKVVTEAVGWDPVDPKSFDTACQKIADGKYFMAINVGGGYNPDKVPCITDAKTYFVGIDALGLSAWSQVIGNALTIAPPSEIAAQSAAEALVKQLPKTAKLGFLNGNNPFQVDSYARVKKVFQSAGFNVVYDGVINSATQSAADANKDVLLSVPKMQAAGVTHVISMLPFTNAGNFAGEADKSGFKPTYSIIEISSGACTTFSASQVSAVMEGATCITNWDNFRYDDAGKFKADSPLEAKCRTDYQAIYGFTTVPGVKFGGVDDGTGTFIKEDQSYFECTLMNQVIIPALKGAGANLTKKTFNDAALKLGNFDVAGFSNEKGSLGPDKPFVSTAVQQVSVAAASKTKGADGLYGKCPAPVNCMRTSSAAGWTSITATLKS
jgi:ABC-type branched-subunit amino acid transport system substrate-binding protein